MNRIYHLIWSEVLNCWVAIAASGRGRARDRAASSSPPPCRSLPPSPRRPPPLGGQVVSGTGSVTQSGATTINQASQNLSLKWKSFNIAPSETVNFVQTSASAIAVNRIFDTNGTKILGRLNANGQVVLINPNGGNGGFIETSASRVRVADDAKVTIAAPQGKAGTWLIDPVDFTIAASSGGITGAALGTFLAGNSITIQTATGTNTSTNLQVEYS